MEQIKDLTVRDFDLFRQLIYKQSGISLNDSKKELLRTRLRKRLVKEGYKSYRDYYNFVKDDKTGQALVSLLDDISTNLTSFYREINHFKFLDSVLPDWIKKKERQGDTGFRIWSAGCSTGEEPYTLAFTMLRNLSDKRGWQLKILATDISTEVLARASAGVYDVNRVKDVPPAVRNAYFEKTVSDKDTPAVRVKQKIRDMILFKRLNLMAPSFPFKNQFDFIFCRNVMIYFDRNTQETLVGKYYRSIKNGGFLLVGHSESLTGLNHQFKYVKPTIYQK